MSAPAPGPLAGLVLMLLLAALPASARGEAPRERAVIAFTPSLPGSLLLVSDWALDDSTCGNNNGGLDSAEVAWLTVTLRAPQTQGFTNVSAELISLNGAVAVSDSVVLFGDLPADAAGTGSGAYRLDVVGTLPSGFVDFELRVQADGGYDHTDTLSLSVGPFALLVEDDGLAENASLYQGPLGVFGINTMHWDVVTRGCPGPGLLGNATAVIWYTGEQNENTLTPQEQTAISGFLDGGGRLFLTGQDLGYDLVQLGSTADSVFYATYLHADYIQDQANQTSLTGIPADPIGDALSLALSGGSGANNNTWPSVIAPRAGAATVLVFPGALPGAVRFGAAHRVVYFAFNFESINTAGDRDLTLARVLNWLLPEDMTPPLVTLVAPNGGEILDACGSTDISWVATDNIAVTEVDLLLSTNGGGSYDQVLATGLANSGSFSWSLAGLNATDLRIMVLARDLQGLQGFDASDSNFAVTPLAPPLATLLAPAAGDTLTCGALTDIVWSMADTCSALDSTHVLVSQDGGGMWTPIGSVAAPDTMLTWLITGSPTDSFQVRIDVVNVEGNATSDTTDGFIVLEDGVPPGITLLSPNGGETLGTGNPAPIDWIATDDKGVTEVDLFYSMDGGGSWTPIVAATPDTPPYPWVTPTTPGNQALIRAVARDAGGNAAADTSDSLFRIVDDDPPLVTLLTPNGGEDFTGSGIETIDATVSDNGTLQVTCLHYSLDNGQSWNFINCGPISFPYNWTVPEAFSDSCLIRVQAYDVFINLGEDQSDGVFRILPSVGAPPDPGLTRPTLLQNHPNPVRSGRTVFSFYLPQEAQASLTVYDVAGRRVRTVTSGSQSAGLHEWVWTGQDEAGRRVGEGLYFYVFETAGVREVRKLVLVR